MPHDSTKVLLGATTSSDKLGVEIFPDSPLTFPAGTAVRRSVSNRLEVAKVEGGLIGISLGKSLSDDNKTIVVAAGSGIPILLSLEPAHGTVTITSYANLVATSGDTVKVGATTFTAQSGAVTPGQTTFRATTGNTETAASLAAQINAHATASTVVIATSALGVVTITAKSNTTAGNSIILEYTDTHSEVGATVSGIGFLEHGGDTPAYVVKGQKVYVSDDTGLADDPNSNSTITDAVYVSGVLTGINESGVEVAVALVDMPGGL